MTPIQSLMRSVPWEPIADAAPGADGLPYATHAGVLDIGGITLRCYRLNTGEAILNAEDVDKLFGGLGDA